MPPGELDRRDSFGQELEYLEKFNKPSAAFQTGLSQTSSLTLSGIPEKVKKSSLHRSAASNWKSLLPHLLSGITRYKVKPFKGRGASWSFVLYWCFMCKVTQSHKFSTLTFKLRVRVLNSCSIPES